MKIVVIVGGVCSTRFHTDAMIVRADRSAPFHDEHKTATESSTGKLTQVTFWSYERTRTDGRMDG